MTWSRAIRSLFLIGASGIGLVSAATTEPLIGDTEKTYTLSADNTRITGIAFDDVSLEAPRLLVLDCARKVYCYRIDPKREAGIDDLELMDVWDLPRRENDSELESPRGLSFSVEGSQPVLYLLNWSESPNGTVSELWRVNLEDGSSHSVNLSLYPFRIGDRELLDVAHDHERLLVCFDASGYTDHNLRVKRGIIQLKRSQSGNQQYEFVRHMPDAGSDPSRGLTCMQLEGAQYFWGTVGGEYIYCAEARAGRGLFHFARPRSPQQIGGSFGLAFGGGSLWVPENLEGSSRVHRVNVTKNLDGSREGPRNLRHLVMTIETTPKEETEDAGVVHHYYSRPYSHEQLHNQEVWPETETCSDTSSADNAACQSFTHDPANDVAGRQYMSCVKYASAPSRAYTSKYEIDFWTNTCRKYVYPHRVDKDMTALEGTDYLADDPELFNLRDSTTYDEFISRVKTYIGNKYGVPADLENPYWAARNALEYIQDHYYYPGRPKHKPAAVDYDRMHYDANPGNLKLELSNRAYDKSQIIACSGTSVALVGVMRYLGIPARWLGTGCEQEPENWDSNNNRLLDADEMARCSNGHRYSQVWLGPHYGWICFDATPSRPDFMDYDPLPPIQPQWRYMNRAAAGHLKDRRIVFNVGSELFRPLYRDFEYDEALAVDNNCGGDQRYNLQGRFDKPDLWKLAKHRIWVKNVCFVDRVTVSGPRAKTCIAWRLVGDWQKDPEAAISVYLQQLAPEGNVAQDVAVLSTAVPCATNSVIVDLSAHRGERCRIMLRKDGDSETGGHSDVFSLE